MIDHGDHPSRSSLLEVDVGKPLCVSALGSKEAILVMAREDEDRHRSGIHDDPPPSMPSPQTNDAETSQPTVESPGNRNENGASSGERGKSTIDMVDLKYGMESFLAIVKPGANPVGRQQCCV